MESQSKDAKADPSVAGKRRRLDESARTSAPGSSSAAKQSQAQQVQSEGEQVLKNATEGLDAATRVYSGLQDEIKRLEKDLELAKEQKQMSDAAIAGSLQQEKLLRESLSETEQQLAAEKKTTAELTSRLEKKEEKIREAAIAGKLRDEEGNRFHYVLARTGKAGSIPRSFLESDADSLLNKMFNGEWDYARNEQGRALLNCSPDHWAAILDYFTTGTLPVERNQGLLDQARHWNLKRLVQTLEALTPGVTVTQHSDGEGLTARCNFTGVMGHLDKKEDLELAFCDFENEHLWVVLMQQEGIYLCFRSNQDDVDCKSKVQCCMRIMLRDDEPLDVELDRVDFTQEGRGYRFEFWGYSYDQLASEPLDVAHDCIVVEVDLTFKE